MLDHVSEDLLRFGDLRFFDASPFECFNYTIKMFIRMTSMKKNTSAGEAVNAMNDSVENEIRGGGKFLNGRPTQLARDGFCISLAGV